MAARSRWLVGSSSNSRSGWRTSTLASSRRPALAARERAHVAAEVALGETDVRGQPPHARLELVAALVGVALLQLAVAAPAPTAAPSRGDPRCGELVVHGAHVREGLEEGVEDGAAAARPPATGAGTPRSPCRARARRRRPACRSPGEEPQRRWSCRCRSAPRAPADRRADEQRGPLEDLAGGIAEVRVCELRRATCRPGAPRAAYPFGLGEALHLLGEELAALERHGVVDRRPMPPTVR
jgi:hypothetical protein